MGVVRLAGSRYLSGVRSESPHYILATAGHVDHGKSSLVKALTGVDPDRLPEEKARGITIDLGFASLDVESPVADQPALQIGIVDVPGHEDFVKNMVSGVSAVDLALLVVAADDGWMPQTEEHFQILQYLGVTHGVVALNKIDLARNEEQAVQAVRDHLTGTCFADAPIVPTSTVAGRGLQALKTALARALATTPTALDIGKPRLAIDRAFSLRGVGTIVTGALIGGRLNGGQTAVIQPSGQATRLRSLQTHNREIPTAGPGMRTAVNLSDVSVANNETGAGPHDVSRGQWLTLPSLGRASKIVDVLLERSARQAPGAGQDLRPLKDSARVRVHHGTQNAFARVLLANAKQLLPGQKCLAQLRLEDPIFAFLYDRFVIRDAAEQTTLAGGSVLDPHGDRKAFRSAPHQSLLQARANSPASAKVALETEVRRHRMLPRTDLLLQSPFSNTEISAASIELRDGGRVVLLGDFLADSDWWKALRTTAADAIDQYHRRHPEHPGIPLTELRTALRPQLAAEQTFDLLLNELRASGFLRTGATLRRGNHRPALPPALQAAGTQVRAALASNPMEPPSRKQLASSPGASQALRFLIQTGEAVEVGTEVVLLAEAYVKAVQLITRHLHSQGSATVSELRQAVGASRRIMVPLLEKLDKDGITRRQGDTRSLRAKP